MAGTNTRWMHRALSTLFESVIGKDVVSRAWRKVKSDWTAWNARDLGDENVVRLVLDSTVVRSRIDRKATAASLRVAVGVRWDGPKVLLALESMGGESAAAWTAFLEDMTWRGLRGPGFVIVDGAPALDAALEALWPGAGTIHKHRSLLAHAPKPLHDELIENYSDMIAADVEARRRAFVHKWRLKCRPVADSLEEAGDRLFTFTRLPPAQWKSARTTNAVERLHEEFRRRIKTHTVLPKAETAPMLFMGAARLGPDHHAQGRRLGDARRAPRRPLG